MRRIPVIVLSFLIFLCLGTFAIAQQLPSTKDTALTVVGKGGTISNPSAPGSYVFYCQWRGGWSDSSCHINHAGCVPTSIAMIMSTFGDTQWTPRTVADANGGKGCNLPGTVFGRFRSFLEDHGYTIADSVAHGGKFDVELARKWLSEGYIIEAEANIVSHSYSGGHGFVITAIDENGNASVLDPNFCRGNEKGRRTFNVGRIEYPLIGNNPWGGAHPIKKL